MTSFHSVFIALLLICTPLVSFKHSLTKDYPLIKYEKSDLPTVEQRLIWQEMHEQFLKTHVKKLMRKKRLRLHCYDCLNLYLIVDVKVNQEGRVTDASIDLDNLECSSLSDEEEREVEQTFLDYLKELQFPSDIRGMSFTVFMGKISPYKC